MDVPRSLLLNWTYSYENKSVDETMEFEETRLIKASDQQELKTRDEKISQLQEMLINAIKERDEAQKNCQRLISDRFLLQQQLSALECNGISSIDNQFDHHCHSIKAIDSLNTFSSSDSDDKSIVSSPNNNNVPSLLQHQETPRQYEVSVTFNKPLPENGKFLKAVVKAGPLLQTLLLAGPMPQWRRPPPMVDHREIPPPPVTISSNGTNSDEVGNFFRKRRLSEQVCAADYSTNCPELKYQKVGLQ